MKFLDAENYLFLFWIAAFLILAAVGVYAVVGMFNTALAPLFSVIGGLK